MDPNQPSSTTALWQPSTFPSQHSPNDSSEDDSSAIPSRFHVLRYPNREWSIDIIGSRIMMMELGYTLNTHPWSVRAQWYLHRFTPAAAVQFLKFYGFPPEEIFLHKSPHELLYPDPALSASKGPFPWYISIREFEQARNKVETPGYESPHVARDFYEQNLTAKDILQCERCERLYDYNLHKIEYPKQQKVKADDTTYTLPYIHCPANSSNDDCEKNANEYWKIRLQQLEKDHFSVAGAFYDTFVTLPLEAMARTVLNIVPRYAEHEIYLGYLACRIIWIRTHILSNESNGLPESIAQICNSFPEVKSMRLWGDIANDISLVRLGVLSRKEFEYIYDQPIEVAISISRSPDWSWERSWLNNYAALRRSWTSPQFMLAKRAVQRVATAMQKLLESKKLQVMYNTSLHKEDEDDKASVARHRFKELCSAIVTTPAAIATRLKPRTNMAPWPWWRINRDDGFRAGLLAITAPIYCGTLLTGTLNKKRRETRPSISNSVDSHSSSKSKSSRNSANKKRETRPSVSNRVNSYSSSKSSQGLDRDNVQPEPEPEPESESGSHSAYAARKRAPVMEMSFILN